MAKKTVRCCRECLNPLEKGLKATAVFCGIPCKAKWNNRRKNRGADAYDILMAMRYDRSEFKRLGAWKELCRMAEVWHDEDKAAGRKSFENLGVVLTRLKDNGAIPRARPMPI